MVGSEIAAGCNELLDEIIDALRKRDERIATLEGRIDTLIRMNGGGAATTKQIEEHETGEIIHWRTIKEARR